MYSDGWDSATNNLYYRRTRTLANCLKGDVDSAAADVRATELQYPWIYTVAIDKARLQHLRGHRDSALSTLDRYIALEPDTTSLDFIVARELHGELSRTIR